MDADNIYDTFCKELKVKTQNHHDRSDKTINLKLAVVLTDTKLWAAAMADFYFVFQTLEHCWETHFGHAQLHRLYKEELFRTQMFEEDLKFYLGSNFRAQIQISDAARDYCDHLMQLADDNPTLLIA